MGTLTRIMSFLRRYWSADLSLTALLVFLCLDLFVVQPMGRLGVAGRLIVGLVFSAILIAGVGAVAKSRRTTVVVGGVMLASLSVRWARLALGGRLLVFWDDFLPALFCIILAGVVLAQVFRQGPITWQRIQGAVAVYLLIGLACAFGYALIDFRWPNAFAMPAHVGANPDEEHVSQFVYFSFVTLTTTGFGDLTPIHPVARSLAIGEALIGQLFPAILLARLVSMEVFHRQTRRSEGGDRGPV